MKQKNVLVLLLGMLLTGALVACGETVSDEQVVTEGATDTTVVEEEVTETVPDVSEYEATQQEVNYTVSGDLLWRQESVEYGEMVEIEYESSVTGKTRKANVLLPAGYTEDKQYPILYLLHGSEGDHNE